MSVSGTRARVLLCIVMLLASTTMPLFRFESASAAQITDRSLTLEKNTGVTTGGSAPSADGGAGTVGTSNHQYDFTVVTTAGINSIGLQYCTTASSVCTAPDDVNLTSATLNGTHSNLGSTPAFTDTSASAGYVAFTGPLGGATVQLQLDGVKNPSDVNTTFFVRITTYTSADATTGAEDAGVVAASTAQTITVTGVMPEYLQFCTNETIAVNANIPDCSNLTDGAVAFNQEFSPSGTSTATSMMAAATNATSGYAITVTGTTLTSGSNTIPQAGSSAVTVAASIGISRFGINLVANTTPAAVGANVNPTSNGTTLRALPAAAYDTDGEFALDLNSSSVIASSDDGTPGTPAPTNSQAYTVTYFATVSGIQPAGTYVATLNYVCTPTF